MQQFYCKLNSVLLETHRSFSVFHVRINSTLFFSIAVTEISKHADKHYYISLPSSKCIFLEKNNLFRQTQNILNLLHILSTNK